MKFSLTIPQICRLFGKVSPVCAYLSCILETVTLRMCSDFLYQLRSHRRHFVKFVLCLFLCVNHVSDSWRGRWLWNSVCNSFFEGMLSHTVTGDETWVLSLEAYWLTKKEKVQADIFNKEDHVHHILGQTGRISAPRHNNKLCHLLWKAEEAEVCN